MARILGFTWVVSLALSISAVAGHADSPRETDRQIEMRARAEFAAGRYDQALELFAKLYADTLHPVYLRNIGRCHQRMHEPEKAIDAFHDYLAKSKKVSSDERKEIAGYIAEMEALRDAQAAKAAPAATLKPAPPAETASTHPAAPVALSLAPPPAPAPGPTEASLVAPASAKAADESPIYTRWWFWTVVGAVVAGGVVTAVVLSSGTNRPGCTVAVCQ